MFRRINFLLKRNFTVNVAVVAMGTAGAQIISMAFMPFITRIYEPEAFGLLGTYMAIVTILIPLAAMSYPLAIVLPRNDKDALTIVKASILIGLTTTSLVLFIGFSFGDLLLTFLDAESIGNYLFFVPVAMFFSVFHQITYQWIIRSNQFKISSAINVAQALIINLMKVCFGLLYSSGIILIFIASISSAIHSLLLWIRIKSRKNYFVYVDEDIKGKPQGILDLLKKYCDFPLFRTPQIVINAFSQALPLLMLVSLFGSAAAGFYALAKMIMGAPSTLIADSVGDVIYPKISQAANNSQPIAPLILKSTVGLFLIAFLPFALVFIFGPQLFSLIFGESWVIAGEYARWLTFFYMFNFLNKPSVASVPVLRIQRGLLYYEIFSTATKILALYIGFYLFENDVVAVAIFSIMGAIAYFIMIGWIYSHAKKRDSYAKTS